MDTLFVIGRNLAHTHQLGHYLTTFFFTTTIPKKNKLPQIDQKTNTVRNQNLKLIWPLSLSSLGPGLLYAAVAVGVSHLVQATRAGAGYGLSMTLIVLIACIIKYPSLRFGGEYATITGKNLVTSYRERGWFIFILFSISQLFSMVFIIAAVALFTSGLLQATTGFSASPVNGVITLLIIVNSLLFFGGYKRLEFVIKVFVVGFTLLTTFCVLLIFNRLEWSTTALSFPVFDAPTVIFIVALIGFMPSPTDASVLQSLWTVAKAQESNFLVTREQSRFDFNVGYVISSVLAIFFLFLGAAVLNPLATNMPSDNAGFASQLLNVYTTLIGDWSFYAIAFTALLVMVSTALAVNDGMTRMAIAIGKEFFPRIRWGNHYQYKLVLSCLSILAVFVIYLLLSSFTRFMDLTSIIVFLIGPFLALLNHLAIFDNKVPEAERPGLFIKTWSILSITCLFLLMAAYIYFRLA